jgi:quercetin dioxygenase-like cupin family protein
VSSSSTATLDPTVTNPDNYKVVFENDRVRVLEFTDQPGVRTTPHEHPDSVLVVLSTFRRRMYSVDGESHDVQLTAGKVGWLDAQQHAGHNIGDTDSHVIFVELKEGGHTPGETLGPVGPAVS